MTQRNVSQQNEATLTEIERTAALATQEPCVRWLPRVLGDQGLSARAGVLVSLKSIPDQSADVYYGLWLTKGRRFHEFTVAVSRVDDSIEVERFQDITDVVVVSEHAPGIGKTFGCLALELLSKLTSSTSPMA